MQKKVFISQPMNGRTYDQILEERKAVVTDLRAHGLDVIDSVFKTTQDEESGNYALACLGRSFEMLSLADIALFLPGWQYARGCWMEHEACIRYGIPIVYAQREESTKEERHGQA